MIAILEKYEHNTDFHQIVVFIEASHLRYALTINPTVYVSHIRQFWSTTRIETTDEGTNILATVDGRIVPLFPSMLVIMSEGSGTPTEPHHTPSLEAQQTSPTATSSQSLPPVTTTTIPTQDEMASKITAQDMEIATLKARIKHLEDRDRGDDDPSREDATIKGRSKCFIKWSSSECPHAIKVVTGSGVVLTASPIFTTAIVATPYTRRKEEELQMMIDGLDMSNEVIAKHLYEYDQAAAGLIIGEKIELINELVKYQDHHKSILKYQAQQNKPLSKKQPREFYMSVLKSPAEEGERFKRKGLNLEQDSVKKVKTSKEVSEEDLKKIMHLVPVEEVYVEALELWALVKETLNIKQATSIPTASDEFPLPEEVPTASEEKFPLLRKRDATTEKFALLIETRVSLGQRHINCTGIIRTLKLFCV
nr:hypothetical protein [Tanacetum cinerariifolium]